MKDSESSSTVVALPTRIKVSPIRLGNIWYTASEMIRNVAHTERKPGDAPYVLMLDANGSVHALLPDDPNYASSVGADGFVSTFDATTPVDQLAASLRAAVVRQGAQESA